MVPVCGSGNAHDLSGQGSAELNSPDNNRPPQGDLSVSGRVPDLI